MKSNGWKTKSKAILDSQLIPPGFKQTEVGVIPEDWEVVPIGKAGEVIGGRQRSPHNVGELCKYLRVANVFDGFLETEDVLEMPFSNTEKERYLLKNGDILLNEGQSIDLVGRSAIYRGIPEQCCFQNTLIRFCANSRTCAEFAQLVFQQYLRLGVFASIASQTTSIAHLGSGRFAALKMPLPPLPEQKAIAEVLSDADAQIESLEQLIVAKTEFKRGLMQQLFSGQRRFEVFKGLEWKQFHLGDLAIESQLRNNGRLTEKSLYAVTKAYGMIPMRERVQGESVERCKVVSKDWFAYNPMRLNIGSIAKWNNEEDVLVSPDYVVFRCDETRLDPDFLNHYRRSHRWTKFVEKAGDGSVRVRIWFSHLAELKLSLPSLPEQRRIAAVLNDCNRELDLLREQLAEFKKQKQGLMQKLLTGQIRVKVAKEAKGAKRTSTQTGA